MVKPSYGYILIAPLTDSFFTMPQGNKMLRMGKVMAVGGNIYHASGNVLPSPVERNATAVFTYYEDEDITIQGQPFYLVPFNRIVGTYAS